LFALRVNVSDPCFRRTLVGLKRSDVEPEDDGPPCFRRTLVGLKPFGTLVDATVDGFRRTLVGLKP